MYAYSRYYIVYVIIDIMLVNNFLSTLIYTLFYRVNGVRPLTPDCNWSFLFYFLNLNLNLPFISSILGDINADSENRGENAQIIKLRNLSQGR